jgi:hypothetical protein
LTSSTLDDALESLRVPSFAGVAERLERHHSRPKGYSLSHKKIRTSFIHYCTIFAIATLHAVGRVVP